MIAILLQTQEGAQHQAAVIPLSTSGANLGTFHAAIRFDPTMILFDGPGITGETDSGQRRPVQVIGCPVCLVTVWGDDQEQAGRTLAISNGRSALAPPFPRKPLGVIPFGRD